MTDFTLNSTFFVIRGLSLLLQLGHLLFMVLLIPFYLKNDGSIFFLSYLTMQGFYSLYLLLKISLLSYLLIFHRRRRFWNLYLFNLWSGRLWVNRLYLGSISLFGMLISGTVFSISFYLFEPQIERFLYILTIIFSISLIIVWGVVVLLGLHSLLEVKLFRRFKISPETGCCICLEENSSFGWISLPCSHRYHQECIGKWLQQSRNCPLCREQV